MSRPTIIGILFLLIGLAIVAVVLAPVFVAIKAHAPFAAPSVTLLIIGLAVLVFGALLIPFSGAGGAASSLLVIAGPYIPTFGRRVGSGEVSAPMKPIEIPPHATEDKG